MIPRTYPSSLNTFSGERQMVVYFLGSVAGLTRWVDYIPVAFPTEASQKENSYDPAGFVAIDSLSSTTGRQAWVDYVPVYLDPSASGAWQVTPTGFAPVNYGSGNITGLFANNIEGVWFDASDMTTMFQDSAGTTPVTALEQPVGLWLDKSGRGNHASQTTAASRPVLSARYNLLTKTEQFDDAAWSKTAVTVAANAAAAPDGTTTADALTPTTTGGVSHNVVQSVTAAAGGVVRTVYAKANGYNFIALTLNNSAATAAWFDLSTLTVSQVGGSLTATSIVDVGNGWRRLSITSSAAVTSVQDYIAPTASFGAYAGDGTSGIYIWGADLRLSSDAALNIPAYQRVVDATTYDTTGFPLYLKFDGVDDSLATGSINFSSNDKMTVWAGAMVASTAVQMLAELSATNDTNNGSFNLFSNSNGAQWALRGDTGIGRLLASNGFALNQSKIVSAVYDIAKAAVTDEIAPRINGATPSLTVDLVGPAGAGNFGNYPLYIGRRGGSTLPFNGRLTQLVVRGAATTDVSLTERFIGKKTGIIL